MIFWLTLPAVIIAASLAAWASVRRIRSDMDRERREARLGELAPLSDEWGLWR